MTVTSFQATPAIPGPVAPEANGTTQETPQRPEWLPEKFQSPEDMAKAYAELEKKLGTPAKPDPAQPAPAAKPSDSVKVGDNPQETQEQAQQVVENAGLNFDDFSTEFADKGELSEASYEKLAKAGIPKAMVDSYIQGQQALASTAANAIVTAAHKAAGSSEAYTATQEWAAANLTQAEKSAYNAVIERGDPNEIALAVQGLTARAKTQGAFEPRNLKTGGGAGASAGYASAQEMADAIKDPRYKSDAAYRTAVERRVALSTDW
jgi:hypothetical protein